MEHGSEHEALVRAHYERLRRLSVLLLGDRTEAEVEGIGILASKIVRP